MANVPHRSKQQRADEFMDRAWSLVSIFDMLVEQHSFLDNLREKVDAAADSLNALYQAAGEASLAESCKGNYHG